MSYVWGFAAKPAGSGAVLQESQSVRSSFTPDVPGEYRIHLIVKDALGVTSEPDEVVVTATNTAPVADAGPDQAISIIGSIVQLSGSTSYDPDGDSVTYYWTIAQKPAGSGATLSHPRSPTPTFIADVSGEYVISLVVTDSFGAESAPDAMMANFANVMPVADAGGNQSVRVGSTVYLDGSGSTDANHDPLTYSWNIVNKPMGSVAQLNNTNTVTTRFVADLAGDYIVSLVVNDGFVASDPSNVSVHVTTHQQEVVDTLSQAMRVINGLPAVDFKNPNMANTLTNKINAALQLIDQGLYAEARDKLQDDILRKTDGCATIGTPDKNDWIIDCAAQAQLYALISEAIHLMAGM